MRSIRFSLAALFLPFAVSANDNVPPAKQESPLLFTGATIHPVSGPAIENGRLLVVDGAIAVVTSRTGDVGAPPGTRTIDLSGKHIYPGMVSANTVLGLTEIRAVRATLDMIEPGAINPNARAQISINPDSELIPVTRANGVLFAHTIPQPGSNGLVAGQSALIRLDGWTWEEMTVKAPAGMHVFWPALRTYPRWNSPDDEEELEKLRKAYEEKTARLAAAFDEARAYLVAREAAPETTKTDLRWEAMRPVLKGDLPVFFHAQSVLQLRHVLHFAATHKIARPVIVGGRDAWRIVDDMKAGNASVILSSVNSLPLRRWEPYDTPYLAPLRLHEAGIPFCIANSGRSFEAPNERNLPYQAGRAVAHGLPRDIALKAVTLYPAQILGIGDQIGSLDPGKEATFFIASGDPLEVRTTVEAAYVKGRKIDLSSKHTRLYEKYQKKYEQLGAK